MALCSQCSLTIRQLPESGWLKTEPITTGKKALDQSTLPDTLKATSLECGYRVDVLVEGALIIELKRVKNIDPIDEAQILTYVKLSGIQAGLMFNFNVTKLKDGIKRYGL